VDLVNDYLLTVLIIILYFAYTGQAWNIMMGFAGQLSLGHAIYVGLGGYVAAIFVRALRHRPMARCFGGDTGCRGCGAIIGFLAFRFSVAGVYFAILTIAFAEFARIGFDIWTWSTPPPACSCRWGNTSTTICGGCAAIRDVLLRHLARPC
jgi:branched-chain amino acid transport system permease protein